MNRNRKNKKTTKQISSNNGLTTRQAKLVYDFIDKCTTLDFQLTKGEADSIIPALEIFAKRNPDFDLNEYSPCAAIRIHEHIRNVNFALRGITFLLQTLYEMGLVDESEEWGEICDRDFLHQLGLQAADDYVFEIRESED